MFKSAGELLAQGHARIAAELATLAELDVRELGQRDLSTAMVEAHRLQAQLDAHVTRVVGRFDTHGDPEGAAGTVPWLMHRCRLTKSQARAELTRARALRRMPEVAAAFAAGEITAEHVRVLSYARQASREAFTKVEVELVEDARTLSFDAFARRVAYFRQVADADRVEAEAHDVFARRAVHASRTFEESVAIDGTLDPIGGSIFKNELDRLERIQFEADWREARDRVGESATSSDLCRTFEQRRADALVEMARRSAAMPADARAGRILLTVLVGYETFAGRMCQLADGTVVTPGQVVPWLTDADVERAVFDGPSRVIDVGARQRLFKGATRRAVEVRDLWCTDETCDVPYERSDIDHIQPWALGGDTVQANGRVRCPRHNPGRRNQNRPPPPDDDEPPT